MDWFETLLLAAALLLLSLVLTRRPMNFPSGPVSPVPLLGSWPAIKGTKARTLHHALWRLARSHGYVMGIFLGEEPVVVVTGHEAVKHVLERDDLAFRPDGVPTAAHFLKKRLGVSCTDGPEWKEQRRFTLRHLRDFGFGKRTMEALIQDGASVLLEAVEAEVQASPGQRERGLDLLPIFLVLAVNILWAIMAGERFDLADERFRELTRAVVAFSRNAQIYSLVNVYSWMQCVPVLNAPFKRQIAAVRQIQEFVEDTIDEHVKTYDASRMRDFIDVYIQEMNAQQENNDTSFTRSQLTAVCMDLFNAGTETTASTLGYCLRYMVQHQHVQDKLRAEVLRVVGSERLPAMSDIANMHYAQAVLHEALRHSGLVPLARHATDTNNDIFGFHVPRGSMILLNLWSVHMDPEVWGDPEEFRPERFIAEDGTFHKNEHLLLFGDGPRVCLGESLARNSTFLFFTSLVQRFQFHVPSLGPPPSCEQRQGVQGFTTSPAPFHVAVTRVL